MAQPEKTASSDPPARVSYVRRLGMAGPLAVLSLILPPVGLSTLVIWGRPIGEWLRQHDPVAALYTLGFTLCGGVALLPTYAQAVLGGWAFGFQLGFPAALMGFSGAALLGYAISRPASGDRVLGIIAENPKWKAVYDALLCSGFGRTLLIVTLLRLPPSSPFAMTNLVLSAVRVPLLPYTLGTLLGLAPRTAVAVLAASGLAELDFRNAEQTWMFVAGIAITIGVLVILGQIARRAITRVTGAAAPVVSATISRTSLPQMPPAETPQRAAGAASQ